MEKLLTDDRIITALITAYQEKPTGGLYGKEIREIIKKLPESVIRCNECEKWHRHTEDGYSHNGYCEWLDVDMWDDGFCSEGVEKIE